MIMKYMTVSSGETDFSNSLNLTFSWEVEVELC